MADAGRPSKYTDDIADLICGELAEGRSLRSICLDDSIPNKATVLRWLADPKHTIFRDQYARAREAQADALFEEVIDIADDGTNDWMERQGSKDESAAWVLNGEHVQRSRLRIDARKWMAGKLAPKKYGEKSELQLTGDPNNPLHVKSKIDPSGLTIEQIRALASIKVPA